MEFSPRDGHARPAGLSSKIFKNEIKISFLKIIIPKSFYKLVKLGDALTGEARTVDFTAQLSVCVKEDCIGGFRKDFKVAFDKFKMCHIYPLNLKCHLDT